MTHLVKHRKFGRTHNQRKALFRGLIIALITQYQRYKNGNSIQNGIITTDAKAKSLRPLVEKCVTFARRTCDIGDDKGKRVHIIRELISKLGIKNSTKTTNEKQKSNVIVDLMSIANHYHNSNRHGGYLSIKKLFRPRAGDSAPMSLIQWVDLEGPKRIQVKKHKKQQEIKSIENHKDIENQATPDT